MQKQKTSAKLNITKGVVMLSIFFILPSCKHEERTKLNRRELTLLDSLYNLELPALRIKSDSMCKEIKDSVFASAVDSLLEIRLAEIELLTEEK